MSDTWERGRRERSNRICLEIDRNYTAAPSSPLQGPKAEDKKKCFGGGWCWRFKKEGLSILCLGQSTHRQKAELSIEGSTPYFLPNPSFFVTWRKKKNRVLQGYCGTAYAVPCQGNQSHFFHLSSVCPTFALCLVLCCAGTTSVCSFDKPIREPTYRRQTSRR